MLYKKLTTLEEIAFEYGLTGLDINRVKEYLEKPNVYNPFENKSALEVENKGLREIFLMYNPEYLYYTAKILLNVELPPIQTCILKEFWTHAFPMLVGSRGLGKCQNKDTIIISNNGIERIRDYIDETFQPMTRYYKNAKLLGENKFTDIDYIWNNGLTETIKLKSKRGFYLEGTDNHPIRSINNNKIEWCDLSNLKVNNWILIDRTDTWFENCNNEIEVDEGYLLGLLVGDGGYTIRGRITYTTADIELASSIIFLTNKYFGKPIKKDKAKYQYRMHSVNIWDKLFQHYEFESPVCAEKVFPKKILRSSKEVVKAFIQGLMDTDGHVSKGTKCIGFSSKSKELVEMLQFVLTKFGIISTVRKKLNKKYQKYYYHLDMFGEDAKLYTRKIGFRLIRKQLLADSFLSIITNTNIDVIPKEFIVPYFIRLKKKYIKNKNRKFWKQNRHLSTCKWNYYDISYHTLNQVINSLITENVNIDDPDFVFIKNIQNKHWFFDKVASLDRGHNYTFDVHLKDDHSFITNGFISHNSFLIAVYSLLRAILYQGTKVVITGAAFRQGKYVYDYIEKIWANAPIAQSIFKGHQPSARLPDMWKFTVGQSEIIITPIGLGEKIRGLRANVVITDEFNSINPEVYEVVISQFAAVSTSPIQNIKLEAQKQILKDYGIILKKDEYKLSYFNNQSIICGTMKFDFEPMAMYWRKYKEIIESKGQNLRQLFGEEISEGLDWKDFAVIRIPFESIPKGYMDEKIVARSKATMHSDYYLAEYNCVPISDTEGFFKRSLIEQCTAKGTNINKENWPPWCSDTFEGKIRGDKNGKYVIGVDPASEQDNFSIVILEVHPEHQRVVYCWTTNRENFKKSGQGDDKNYYAYCARKIRNLMRVFPTIAIGCDSQGGGYAVEEALHDMDKLQAGEVPIWPIIDPDKESDTDDMPGQHILHMIQFSSAEWTSNANHGMKKDMEDKLLLFPNFNSVLLGLASEKDKEELVTSGNINYDTTEDCLIELEALKDELSIITRTRTPAGRERWDTPEIKLSGTKKARLRKDRYSALLIANSVARTIAREFPAPNYQCIGAAVGSKIDPKDNRMYVSEWYLPHPSMFKAVNRG